MHTLLPDDTADWKSGDGALDDGRLPGDGGVLAHGPDVRRTVDVEPGSVVYGPASIDGRAAILPAVVHAHRADVHVGDNVAVDGHVLADHEPESRCWCKRMREKGEEKCIYSPVVLGQRKPIESPGEVRRWITRGDALEGHRRSRLYSLLDELVN